MRKVLLLPTLIVAGLAVAALAAVAITSRSATREVERRIDEVRRGNALAFRIAHLTGVEQREVLAYRLEPTAATRARIEQAGAGMDAAVVEMGGLDLPPRGQLLFEQVLAARAVRDRERERLLGAIDAGSPPAVARAHARWDLASGAAGALAADLSVFNLRRLERAVADVERVRSRSVALLVLVLGASAALVLAFWLAVDRWLVRPVRAMTEAARRIASERVALPVPGGGRRDELGVLARAMTRTADDLVRANAELERSVAARDDFLSIASHELKTPLTALKLQLQIGQRRLAGDAGAGAARPTPPHGWLAAALRQLERVEALVEELLDLTRIRSGRLTLRVRTVDLSELARSACERLRAVLARTGNALEVEAPEQVLVACDPGRVEQVIVNLLVNASRHAPGTRVRVRAAREEDRAVLAVEDEGPGIPPEARERVFAAYEKVQPGRGHGLGLGLYIVRQILEAHGGRIEAGAGAAGGARFTAVLPVAEAARAAGGRGAAP
jgi:signal transduction histidine kinase